MSASMSSDTAAPHRITSYNVCYTKLLRLRSRLNWRVIRVVPRLLTEVIHLYLARELTAVTARPEEHEVIEIQWVPFEEAVQRAVDGRIRDAKSLIGLLWARERLGSD